MRARALVLPLLVALAAVGCSPTEDPAADVTAAGSLKANLVIPEGDDDVASVRLEVFDADGTVVESHTVEPGDQPVPGTDAVRRGGDVLMTLRPGDYRAVATPLDADGGPSQRCGRAAADVNVQRGRTTEIVLAMQCGDGGTGGLDVVLTLEHPPVITDLQLDPSKFVDACQPTLARVTVVDAEADTLTYAWSQLDGPAELLLNGNGAAAWIAGDTAGTYEVEVVVTDAGGATAALSFPVHVQGDSPNGCPGGDIDQDGVPEIVDNCPGVFDPTQADRDGDGLGDVCVDGPNAPLFLDFVTDGQLQPAQPFATPILQAQRPVARLVGPDGDTVDFVANELLVAAERRADVDALLGRFGGEVLATFDPADLGATDAPVLYQVRVELDAVDPADLPALARAAQPQGRGVHRVSSDDGLRLLTVAATAHSDMGLKVAMNFLLTGDDVPRGFTTESAAGPGAYSSDAFDWPYLNRGSAQDFGAADAWRLLSGAGRLATRVRLLIADGGFLAHPDLPGDAIAVNGPLGRANPGSCGGGPCPWHGTQVTATAAALPDNGFGVAGSGGPVVRPLMLQSPDPDFVSYLRYIFRDIPAALGSGGRIVNISASGDIPAVACAFACPALNIATRALRSANVLVYASAGNDGRDVDSEDCFLRICWEGFARIPCELDAVECVGGLAWDSDVKAGNSAFGRDRENTVDIYGPYTVYGPVPDGGGAVPDQANLINGTSFSSPFVAGCAALVMAADPSLGAGRVARLLRDTAHTGGRDGRVNRWVDCFEGVRQALGGDAPPLLRITAPADGSRWVRGVRAVPLAADATDEERGTPEVLWFSDRQGLIGSGTFTRTLTLVPGPHTLTAIARDGRWEVSDSVDIVVDTALPTVRIDRPLDGAEHPRTLPLRLQASGRDPSNPPTFGLADAAMTWRIDGLVVGNGPDVEVPAGTLAAGEHTVEITVDGVGGSETDAVTLTITEPGPDLPPRARVLGPAHGFEMYVDRFDGIGWYAEVELRGEGTDDEDGALPDAALTWTVTDEAGVEMAVGSGRRVLHRFYVQGTSAARYTVTLTVEDSASNVTSQSVQITIEQLI